MSLQTTLVQLIQDTVGTPRDGVEVGVYKGETSSALIEAFPLCTLHLVDPWCEWPEGASYRKHKRTGNLTAEQWERVYTQAQLVSDRGGDCVTIHRGTSAEAATKALVLHSFDFVFIDADHTYEQVRKDIRLWRPKVRAGGLLCGHDYGGRYRGVSRAVNQAFGDRVMKRSDRVWGVLF